MIKLCRKELTNDISKYKMEGIKGESHQGYLNKVEMRIYKQPSLIFNEFVD